MLEVKILFDPSEAWSNVWEFEADLTKFFGVCGFDAQIVKAVGI